VRLDGYNSSSGILLNFCLGSLAKGEEICCPFCRIVTAIMKSLVPGDHDNSLVVEVQETNCRMSKTHETEQ
jgi:hypothetical protein